MSSRVSNRWLNPALLELREPPARDRGSSTAPRGQNQPPGPLAGRNMSVRGRLSAGASGRTRSRSRHYLLRGAAAVLLLGSAAFSYFAWSQGSAPGGIYHRSPEPGVTALATGDRAAHSTATPDDARARVHALRQKNAELHQRLGEVQTLLAATGEPGS